MDLSPLHLPARNLNDHCSTTDTAARATASKIQLTRLLLTVFFAFAGASVAIGQGTVFTYQGHLNNGGQPANGSYDLRFTIYDAAGSIGNVLAGPLTNSATSVASGLFTVTMDFGNGVFTGAPRWLEISARTNGGGAFVTLNPRQELTPSPYAIMAGSSSNLLGTLPAAQLSGTVGPGQIAGTYSGRLTLPNPLNVLCGDGSCLTGVNASLLDGLSAANFWKLTGNGGTTTGVNFLGTTDNEPLDFKVNNTLALQIDPAPSLPNLVGGLAAFRPTVIRSNVSGAVVAGGMAPSAPVTGFGGGDYHAVFDNDGTIDGGFGNKVGTDNGDPTDAAFATVAGGVFNSAANYAATVAGGDANAATGNRAAVLGGFGNQAGGYVSAVGGGQGNQVAGQASVIAGGTNNVIQTGAAWSAIGGGGNNFVATLGMASTIAGGQGNSISNLISNTSTGAGCTIGGGEFNAIGGGDDSTIAGGSENHLGTNVDEVTIGGGEANSIQDNTAHSSIAGGFVNLIGSNCDISTIAGGRFNEILSHSLGATIGGGEGNQVGGKYSLVGGGNGNLLQGDYTTISGGRNNSIQSDYNFIGGGYQNTIAASTSAIGSGQGNSIQFGAFSSFIGGGDYNMIQSNASYAVIPGGLGNTATDYAFAAGTSAQATNTGTFVWADYQGAGVAFGSINDNEFAIRATGGVRFVTGLDVSGSPNAGVSLAPGDTSWGVISDRNAKKNFAPVNSEAVLETLASVPVQRWNYYWESENAVPHLGPMAQDFKHAFYPGRDDKSITTLEFDGVELAAIQGLNQKLNRKLATLQEQLKQREVENAELKVRLEALERFVRSQASD